MMDFIYIREKSDKYSVKILQNSYAELSNISKSVCRIIKSSCAEQDNYFLINVECRSVAIMIKWPHAAIFEW